MSVARRPLLTSAAAAAVLGALWFVPSANATMEEPQTAPGAKSAATGPRLAETGSVDTTPYVVGGAASLAAGVGLVVYAVRREAGAGGGA
ncbi:LAETG motif-containing sortase-dependent surface protein [Streptomyces apocyni]|uniref:LAETG motif-containing sortase-dependent surface protein n=1 Tax=Streptomyces apocyni TaxID=2654677 RepID=UPI0012EA62A2|nr:LAETG motif-containing sortase-dependent surface protein [Streptomyces apocyni]